MYQFPIPQTSSQTWFYAISNDIRMYMHIFIAKVRHTKTATYTYTYLVHYSHYSIFMYILHTLQGQSHDTTLNHECSGFISALVK